MATTLVLFMQIFELILASHHMIMPNMMMKSTNVYQILMIREITTTIAVFFSGIGSRFALNHRRGRRVIDPEEEVVAVPVVTPVVTPMEWTPEMKLIKHDVKRIPIWMKIHGLDVKYWGMGCLKKLCEVVGKFICCDEATLHKNFLGFARIMIEVDIGQDFPEVINFHVENGETQTLKVVYDWLPLSCTTARCGSLDRKLREGGSADVRRRGNEKRVTPDIVLTPVMVAKTHVVENSIPRRFLTKLLRTETGGCRSFASGGVSFMENLSSSLQKSRLGLIEHCTVDKGGTSRTTSDNGLHKGGRIWVIWDPQLFEVDILDVSVQCIHSLVTDKVRKMKFWFTVVYGMNKAVEREPLWSSIRHYYSTVNGSWIVGGDFNTVLARNERIGGAPITNAEMRPLLQVVHDYELADLGARGAFFTWTNKHETGSKIYSRIDRMLVNDKWIIKFPNSYVHFLPEGMFDHCPALVKLKEEVYGRRAPFKYFNMWSLAPEYGSIIQNGWQKEIQGTAMYQVVKKLKTLKYDLKQLNKCQFADIENLTNVAEIALK
ncbi:uncharacterized protein LOC141630450 [Silene latifolia]|uniref:uncharacterized protein LOC141630450 n=1 Tax=Silene latifolia TaxID=37657 RepID=UPI003D76EF0D